MKEKKIHAASQGIGGRLLVREAQFKGSPIRRRNVRIPSTTYNSNTNQHEVDPRQRYHCHRRCATQFGAFPGKRGNPTRQLT